MKFDLRCVCHVYGLKCAKSNVQGYGADFDACCPDPRKDFRRKVQPCSRRRCRPTLSRINRLISLAIERPIIAANVRRQRRVADRIEPPFKVRHRCKSQYPFTALPRVHDLDMEVCVIPTGKLDSVAHPELAARLHQSPPLPSGNLFRKQYFNAARSSFLFIRAPASRSKKASRNDARIIQHQHVSWSKVLRELRKDLVLPCACRSVEQEHTRAAACFRWLLCNQFLGQGKVKIRDEHSLILVRCGRITGEMAFGQSTQSLERLFGCEPG